MNFFRRFLPAFLQSAKARANIAFLPFFGKMASPPLNQLIMRLNLIILFSLLSALQVLASNANGQTITLKATAMPIAKVLDEIKKQSGYGLFYDKKDLPKDAKITIDLQRATPVDALEQCMKNQPLQFQIVEQMIIIKAKEKTVPLRTIEPAKQNRVSGKVTNEKGDPLPGVTVTVKGTSRQTATDNSGNYSINANTTEVLVFSFLGYTTVEREIRNNPTVDVLLSDNVGALDQVQIQGYGVTTQRLATGNISTIKAETISQQPVTNLMQSINGRIAGVQITQNSSIPGSPLNVQIRGVNSLGNSSSSNRPLFIIDDVPFPTEPIASFGFLNAIEPTNILNPGDIESITILKDADATAIYGSRGANGVVLITTKKGKPGKARFDVDFNKAFSTVSRIPELMSTTQYLQVRRDAFANSNIIPTATNAPDLITWDQNEDNRILQWYMGNTSNINDLTASFSGGSEGTQFLVSSNYRNEENVFAGDNNYRRANIHFSLNHTSINKRLKLGFSGLYSTDNNKISNNGSNNVLSVSQTVPNYPIYDQSGKFNWLANLSNPYAVNTSYSKLNTSNINLNLKLSYDLLKKLNFTSNFGYRTLFNDVVAVNPSTAKDPALGTFAQGNSAFYNTNTSSIVAEPQFSFNEKLGAGTVQILIGSTIQKSKSRNDQLTMINYLSDLLLEGRNGGTLNSATSAISQYNFLSAFGRINYNLQDKYILKLTFRRDGSSRFGPNNKFGNFGSAGAAWLFSKENFIANTISFLSYGKIRGSYGTTGSDGIGDFAYLSLYTTTIDYGTQKAISPSQIANPDYKWELTKKLELGLDLGFFEDKILLSSAWYRNRSGNQLVLFPLPATTGFTGYTANLPALVQNSGWEFDLNTKNVSNGKFSWNSALTLTIPKNKLLTFPGIEQTSFANTHVIGKPVRSYLAFQLQGIDPNTGLATVMDVSGNGTISSNSSYNGRGGDRIWVGTSDPKWFAGMSNNFNYKGFQLDIFFQYTKQMGYNLFSTTSFGSFGTLLNGFTQYLDYWKTPGQEATIPKPFASLNTGVNRFAASDRAFSDASFLRLKNVSLSYQLSSKWFDKVHLKNLQIFAQGQNLWTITKYEGADPETAPAGAVAIPSLRTISFGLKAGL